jgi:hypothetical protein
VVDAKGRLHVLYTDYKENRRDFSALPGPAAELPFGLVLATSADGGKTFDKNTEIESNMVALRRFLIYLPEFPQMAAGPGDNLYVTWADGRSGDEDVLLRRSKDGGATWTEAVKVNDNPANDGTAQFLPKVDVGPGERVSVLFLDGRNDAAQKHLLDAYLATSTDGGKSFDNIRVSDKSFDGTDTGPSFGPDYGIDFGTKLGLAHGGGTMYAAWVDTVAGSPATGREDVNSAAIQLPGTSSRGLALGIILVLFVAGGALGLALSRRNRGDPPTRTDAQNRQVVPS